MANYQIDNLKPVWVTVGIKDKEPVNWAKRFGDYLGDEYLLNERGEKVTDADNYGNRFDIKSQLSTSQLRNFFW